MCPSALLTAAPGLYGEAVKGTHSWNQPTWGSILIFKRFKEEKNKSTNLGLGHLCTFPSYMMLGKILIPLNFCIFVYKTRWLD